MPATKALPSYIALAGPTASGKTAAAFAIAARHPVEIVSVDSALVYRGMDIGTAKPSAAERALVPHHLIDIRDPHTAYSAAEFVRDASALITAITARGKLPLLVGGTMLYFKALAEGLDDMPAANAEVRAAIAQDAQTLGWPALHAQLAAVDPATAARLAPADSQRIQRALEVYRVSGQPLSVFQQAAGRGDKLGADGGNIATQQGQASVLISLEPQDRAWLHQRIAQRFDAMLADGLLDEVQRLRALPQLHADLPSMRCVGYRQAWEALDAHWPPAELRERGIAATRQLAKRQLTWLRSMPQRQAVACDAGDALERVLRLVKTVVGSRV
ncbi:tRNA (adenosine(37)-N6)-dimethylallyltransferase MiaA [Rhodoferax sp.]|jgi:tRNA dimethylallyltransferase|uniref:tRNA (adenosine(37)-N6)-dimethylallyltransferase MiaA n=1 Tax=Rhodoferax sp. TaxID=50421 RepID=UPI0037844F4E